MLLEVKDLVVGYGNIEALHGISFNVDKGEIVTLIGANGAGKTSTLLTLSRLPKPEAPTVRSGDILYNGESILLTEDASFISELGKSTNSNDNQVDGRPGVSVQKKYFEDNSISVATIKDNDEVFFNEMCIDSPSVELSNGIKIGASAKEVKDVYSINDDSFKCFTYTGCLNEDRITTTYNFGNYEVFFDFGGPSGASDKKIDGEEKLEHIRIIYKPIQQKYTMSAD